MAYIISFVKRWLRGGGEIAVTEQLVILSCNRCCRPLCCSPPIYGSTSQKYLFKESAKHQILMSLLVDSFMIE